MVKAALFANSTNQRIIDKYRPRGTAVNRVIEEKSRQSIAAPEEVAAVMPQVITVAHGQRWQVVPDSRLVDKLKRFLPLRVYYRIWKKEFGPGQT